MAFTESNYENAIIELMRDELGYNYIYGPNIKRDYKNPLFEDVLAGAISQINPKAPIEAINEALFKLRNIESGSLILKNKMFMNYLQNGIEVTIAEKNEQKNYIVYLVDYKKPNNNNFTIINQWTIVENENKRPDIIVFINGIPIVVMELKSPSRENVEISNGYRQLRNYMLDIPCLFTYNAFLIMSDMIMSKVGTITSGEDRFMEWKTIDGDNETNHYAMFDILIKGMLQKERLLDLIKNFIIFSDDNKILSAYHQYFAVKKAISNTTDAIKTDGKAGVIWHTQGSGKSFSMVFYTKLLTKHVDSPTIIVLTDRNDLDDQLFKQFVSCKDYLRQEPLQAKDRTNLKALLENRIANGIIFTTMQKFEESSEPLSERRNIILIADEAHRSQYALNEKVDIKTGKVKLGYARLVRESLPNATFIGFTGTPITLKDRNTKEIFGEYIDVYDMTQAVLDGATRPVYYESRVINLGLNENVLKQIDSEYEILAQNADSALIEKSQKELSRMDEILGAEETIKSLCTDIIAHYEDRQNILTGKAMIVAYSRPIAIKIYNQLINMRKNWSEKVKIIMTSGNDDPEDWKQLIGNKTYKKELARKFKDNTDEMKIAIVVDMWLTGFDVPSLATMYIYKPMAGHNLMQAIARVNRVFEDKEGGLVVDYVGIASALKQAMKDFTLRDRNNYGDTDIKTQALPKFIEKLEICKDLFHGFDYNLFESGTDLDRAKIIIDGLNFIVADEVKKPLFIKEALLLKQASTLCLSLLSKTQRFESAMFEAIRTGLSKVIDKSKFSLKDINERISELLKHSIKSDGIINIFGDDKSEFSIFDPKFLEEIASMKQKNLAAQLLAKLLEEQITVFKKTNLVQATVFSERMIKIMNAYRNGQISNAEVIDELRNMATDMQKNKAETEAMGLTDEQKAFFDALAKPSAIKDFYTNDSLVQITKELTEMLRKSRTIDWQKKEAARASMRSMVKRLLKKYKYPPDGQQDVLVAIIAQCELWVDK